MNREEAIECLEVHAKELKRRGFEDMHLRQVKEYLERPLTLADFLDWEEGVEYRNDDFCFKIVDDTLYEKHFESEIWRISNIRFISLDFLSEAREVKKKAWRVRDKYSFKCLMEELEEQGYMWGDFMTPTDGLSFFSRYQSNTVVYGESQLVYSTIDWYNLHNKNKYDLVEYHKEEKLYAKIKGWELASEYERYWNYSVKYNNLIVSCKHWKCGYKIKLTKREWNELGINENNADFERVEE
ncbi:hypothetical protein GUI37_06055 [Helcococcus kunzii]|uniref:hypothetical protein n=1 Tax=Helcococcus kunzii TaxID=40091 RepID=UPI001BAFC4C9|nr:hypothetical protein [Helcococcus kunzii]QUY65103.1 hypothetical protein GUI37_06055 [Helcococcus kunzii]